MSQPQHQSQRSCYNHIILYQEVHYFDHYLSFITVLKNKLLFFYLVDCTTPLGLEDLRIQDSQITARSYYESLSIGGGKSVDTEPKCARLNKNNCAWCAPRVNGQYLQVDLRRNFIITGIATQGFEALNDYYVRRYKVSHSRNGHTWSIFPVSINLTFSEINDNNSNNDNTISNISG